MTDAPTVIIILLTMANLCEQTECNTFCILVRLIDVAADYSSDGDVHFSLTTPFGVRIDRVLSWICGLIPRVRSGTTNLFHQRPVYSKPA